MENLNLEVFIRNTKKVLVKLQIHWVSFVFYLNIKQNLTYMVVGGKW